VAGALEGIRIVEFASYVSGPYAGMMLGDLGAEVIKVETPGKGDPFRSWGRVDYSPTFGSVNRNKKSVTLDLKTPDGKADARLLAGSADVVIENMRAGAMDRLGLGYADLAADHPRLIYCSITGYGNTGPYAKRPGYDTVGQATSGLLSLLTDMDSPRPMGISLSDHLSGMVAAQGILAALVARGVSGKGQRVDTSLLEATLAFCGENAANYFETGKVPNRALRTQRAQVYAFVAGDGQPFVIHLSSPQKFWEGLVRVVKKPEWLADPRFATRETRGRNYRALEEGLQAVFSGDTRAAWLDRLLAEDVPAAPLNTFDDVFNDPQVQHLEMRVDVPHRTRGKIGLLRNGLRMSGTPPTIRTGPPELGEHTDELLTPLRAAGQSRN
jgi:crotonobetainyl-CoA:carnitine CoA-transferase CaiB-like acyl-CoA transferase